MIKKLFFEIGGYNTDHYKIEIIGINGFYNTTSSGPYLMAPREFEINTEKTEQFIQILNEIDVWSWHKEYFNAEVMDGIQWKLEILMHNGKKIKSEGSNKYPGSEDIDYSEQFTKLIKALELLLKDIKITF